MSAVTAVSLLGRDLMAGGGAEWKDAEEQTAAGMIESMADELTRQLLDELTQQLQQVDSARQRR